MMTTAPQRTETKRYRGGNVSSSFSGYVGLARVELVAMQKSPIRPHSANVNQA